MCPFKEVVSLMPNHGRCGPYCVGWMATIRRLEGEPSTETSQPPAASGIQGH